MTRGMNVHTRAIRVWVEAHPGCTATQVASALGLHPDWVRQALDNGVIFGRMWRLHVGAPPAPDPGPPPMWVSATTDDCDLAHELTRELLAMKERAGMSDETLRSRMLMPDTRYLDRWRDGVSVGALATALRWALALGYTIALVPIGSGPSTSGAAGTIGR